MVHEDPELWKNIDGHDGYEVSSKGRVKSKRRIVRCGPGAGNRVIPGKILSPFRNTSTGYLQVHLTRHKKESVHRLVATAFIGCPEPNMVVNHINGDRKDNRAVNLEWVTHSENHKHSYVKLGRQGSFKGKFGVEHCTSKPVIRECPVSGEVVLYDCAMDAVREGYESASISRCCNGKIKTHKGYKWYFGSGRGVQWSEPAKDLMAEYGVSDGA